MSRFSAGWLALREPFDTAARNSALAATLNDEWSNVATRRIIDLATGTGANLKYLAPRLGGNQLWLLVDHDVALLAEIPREIARWARVRGYHFRTAGDTVFVSGPGFSARIRCEQLDLAVAPGRLPLAGMHLVTASALLDLVSEAWLRRLADACGQRGCAALFALTYDGHIEWAPAEASDALLHRLFNLHQETEKGFGPALGPAAAEAADALFTARGYRTASVTTPWRIDAKSTAMQCRLIDDWSAAATEINPLEGPAIRDWRQRRLRQVARGRSRLTVGHIDLLALPD